MIDPIAKLAEIFPNLQNGHKAAAREVKEAVLEMQATIADLESALARQPLPEAPASATVKVVDPTNQAEWLLTFRFHTEDELLAGVARISGKLPALGVVGFDAYVDSRRADRAGLTSPAGNGGTAPRVPLGGIPQCPDGHGAMKASTKVEGEFYCSAVVGTHPQTGKKLYCMHKARG